MDKFLNLEEPDQAAAWLTQFKADAIVNDVSAEKMKVLFLSKCGVNAIVKLKDMMYPQDINKESCTYEDILENISRIIKPKERLIVAERMQFLEMKQEDGESFNSYLNRLNRQAVRCEFEKLKEDPGSELTKLIFLSVISSSITKLQLLDHLRIKENMTISEIVSMATLIESERSFAEGTKTEAKETIFRGSTQWRQQPNNYRHNIELTKNAQQKASQCGNCGRWHPKRNCPAKNIKCFKCQRMGHFKQYCRSTVHNVNMHQDEMSGTCNEEVMSVNYNPAYKTFDSFVTCLINGRAAKMQIDTGAVCSILPYKLTSAFGLNVVQSNRKLTTFDGRQLQVVGETTAPIEYGNISGDYVFVVIESPFEFGFLGRDLLNLSETLVGQITEELPVIKGYTASVKLADETNNKICPARPVPIHLVTEVKAELRRLEALGIISPCSYAGIKNASPVVWVRKRDGTLRMCADYKVHINDRICTYSYPLPNIETLFANMDKARYFSKIDLRSAYWQIPLDAKSQEICCLNTSNGLYKVNRLQMGLKNSGSIFQHCMETILADIPGIRIYQDDILVYAANMSKLKARENMVFQKLKNANVTMNIEKCLHRVNEVDFLGVNLSSKGLKPSKTLIEKIQLLEAPSNIKELERFLGLVGFYRRFLHSYADLVEPLLAAKRGDFCWGKAQEEAFQKLKFEITQYPVLKPFSLSENVLLTVDASEYAAAGILSQNGQPVAFISHTFTDNERNWSNVEREAFAVVWCVERLRYFLLGKRFKLETDHSPLTSLFGNSLDVSRRASQRIARWALTLSQYDFEVVYIPGSRIPHVDAMSRLKYESDKPEELIFFSDLGSENSIENAFPDYNTASSIAR